MFVIDADFINSIPRFSKGNPSGACDRGVELALGWVGDRRVNLTPDAIASAIIAGVEVDWFAATCEDPSMLQVLAVHAFGINLARGGIVGRAALKVLGAIADNGNASEDTLRLLSSHPDVTVRTKVANNATLESTLDALAGDSSRLIHEVVALNARTGATTLAALACSRSATVRENVAQNANTDDDTLLMLRADRDRRVAYLASEAIMSRVNSRYHFGGTNA